MVVPKGWPNMARPQNKKAKVRRPHPSAVAASMPSVVEPMLPMLVREPFSDPEFLFEPKLDGYRAICFVQDGRVRFLSRKGHSLTERFPELRRISVKASTAVLDGEVVALGQDGKPCFEGLHGRAGEVTCVIVFFAFDLLYLDGYDLTQCPLVARKAALKRILPKGDTARIRYTEHFLGSGKRLFSAIEKMQLEGMVAKRKDSVYSRGRSRLWQKVKTTAGRGEMQKRIETWGK
jgi:bifunctional non-homologous end joining protein LigD